MDGAVILPSRWSYIVQKQLMGGQSGCDRDTSDPTKRCCTIEMILKRLF